MKELTLLTWLTQLGLSIALPMAGFVILALWLQDRFDWGDWVIWTGTALGFLAAFDGLRHSLKLLSRLSKKKSGETQPPVFYNDHD